MMTECITKARARRVSALGAVESRRANHGMPQDGSRRQLASAGLMFKSSRS